MKVLWFCNILFTEKKIAQTGTWLVATANALKDSGEVELYNITRGDTKGTVRKDCGRIKQWQVPDVRIKKKGLPSDQIIGDIQDIVEEINPDVIHIWGTESYWGLLSARGYIQGNVILEIQGMMTECWKYVYSGLSWRDVISCFGVKEILKPQVSLFGQRHSFKKRGILETEMLQKHDAVSTQSNWVRSCVKRVNPEAKLFETIMPLRREFIESERWQYSSCQPFRIFTSTSGLLSYKGIHVLADAVAHLKQRFPDVRLVIAGYRGKGIRQGGYTKWLLDRIKRQGIEDNIEFTGPLDAKTIVNQMKKANVVAVPSFIETYCVGLDEALTVGVPCVVSFSGAMPELAVHRQSALYFSPGDAGMCADAIEEIFTHKEYADYLSTNAYKNRKKKNNYSIADVQLSIYRDVINSAK